MKNFKKLSIPALGLVFALALATGPVFAQHGAPEPPTSSSTTESGSSGSGSTGGSTSGSTSGSGSGPRVQRVAQTGTNPTETTTGDDSAHPELHKKGADDIAELKKTHKEHSAEERTKLCESHKQGLDTKFSKISTNGQRIQDKISSIFDKAVAYKDANSSLDPANWDALVATATTAKDTSAKSLEALKAVTPTIDCNNTSVASDVATFKAAAATARDNLKAYRTAVKDVIKSLRDAKKAASTTSDSTSTDTTQTTTGGTQQ